MIDSVKISLRISDDNFNDEILDLIESAKKDLEIAGVENIDIEDPLIRRAITIYVKANFGWDNPDAEKLQELYILLKQHLSLAGDYNVVE